ncbi:unnamed protein product, partial [marine sediment metagenome]
LGRHAILSDESEHWVEVTRNRLGVGIASKEAATVAV